MWQNMALPVAEMGLLAVIASMVLRSAVEGRVAAIVTLFVLMAALAAYGVVRALSGAELRTLAARVMPRSVWHDRPGLLAIAAGSLARRLERHATDR